MRKTILFLLGIALSLLASTQLVNAEEVADAFVSEHGDFFRLLRVDGSDWELGVHYQPYNEEDGGPGEFDFYEVSLRGELPFPRSEDSFVRAGLDYGFRRYEFEQLDGPGLSLDTEQLHRIGIPIGFGQFFDRDLLLTGVAIPGFYSDFDETIDDDDFQLHAEGMIVYRFNPATQFLFGISYGEDYDDTPILPLVGLRLLSENGKVHISVTAPLEARIGYSFSPKAEVYGGYWVSGYRYHVRVSDNDDDEEEFNWQVQDRKLGVGAVIWFADHVNLRIEGGASIGSEFELKTRNPGQFADGDLDSAGYLSLSMGMNL